MIFDGAGWAVGIGLVLAVNGISRWIRNEKKH